MTTVVGGTTYPCHKCGKPVQLSDLVIREFTVRQQWRWENPPAAGAGGSAS